MNPLRQMLAAMVPGGLPAEGDFDISPGGEMNSLQRTALLRAAKRMNSTLALDALESVESFNHLLELVGEPKQEDEGGEASFGPPLVQLRPLVPDDYLPLYYSAVEPSRNISWRFRGRTPSFDEFRQSLFAGVLAQFIVCDAESGDPMGHVVAYDHSVATGHCKVGYCGLGSTERRGQRRATSAGLFQLISYCFDSFLLRKIYLEVPAYNLSMVSGMDSILVQEGQLTDYLAYKGEPADLHILSLSADSCRQITDAWPRVY